jgi:translation initiation factor 2B subunit (eIF-2B alpha/beta/delta family)
MGFEDKLSEHNKARLEVIKGKVKGLYSEAKGMEGAYVPHDERHCGKVQEYLDRIVPADALARIPEDECFLVLCGVWLHDVGMIPQLFGPKDISNIEAVRKEHHKRSAKYVDKNWSELGLELDEVSPIVNLCFYHRRSTDLQDLDEEPRLQYLVALLRLADACHSDYTRTPPEAYRLNLAVGISSEHLLHWVKSLIVTRVEPDPERGLIRLSVVIPPRRAWFNADFGKLAELVVEDMQHELEGVRYYLPRYAGYMRVQVASVKEVTRQAEDWGIYEALCAYEIPKTPNATAVLNTVLETLDVIADKAEVDRIEERYQKALDSAVKEKGHQLGLLRLKSDVRKACSSKEGKSLRTAIRQCTKHFRRWKTKAQRRIADIAVGEKFVLPGDSVLVYSNSSCICTVLGKFPKATRRKVKVYVGESRSKSTYDALGRPTYSDGHALALKLAQMGYQVSLVADAAIPHFMAEGEIKKVLTGTNGIGYDGSSSHPVGHLMVAESAEQYKIPFYVFGETFKVGTIEKIEEDGPNLWLCGSFDTMFRDLIQHGIEVPRPKQDIVPANLITNFVTEKGIFKPTEIEAKLKAC